MKNEKEVLSSVLKTTQMGQLGIRSALNLGMQPSLHKALESQLREYDSIESEAHAIAAQRGWELRELDTAVRIMTDMSARMNLSGKNSDSKIAGMMIRGNTKGLVNGLRDLHRMSAKDVQIRTLSQKLIDTENSNIRQMQEYL